MNLAGKHVSPFPHSETLTHRMTRMYIEHLRRKEPLEKHRANHCPHCRGLGYIEWPTGCPECGASPPCETDEKCTGPDEVCRVCSGSGRAASRAAHA